MIAKLIEWSLRNQVLVVIATILAVMGGIWSVRTIQVDAIPDLSDVQVIVYTEYPGQAPQVVEDQVSYPITTTMLSVPHAKTVRGYSYFGFSFVYVIFEDGTDLYWARSRVLESLNGLGNALPDGVTPRLGPDATGVGWAFMYVLNSPTRPLDELRSLQDWYLRYGLMSVEGVSEVASLGGFVRQYQIEVDPIKMRAHAHHPRQDQDRGSTIQQRGRRPARRNRRTRVHDPRSGLPPRHSRSRSGSTRSRPRRDAGSAPRCRPHHHRPRDPARPRRLERRGRDRRRDHRGAFGGRHPFHHRSGQDRVWPSSKEGLPDDVTVEVAYDRTGLIDRAVDTLERTLIEETLIVALVCAIFLFHFRSAFVAVVSIPAAILLAFIVMRIQGLGANIMSLGGIAISIGVLVDASVVMVENAHKHLEEDDGKSSRFDIILASAQEVGPTLFFSLLVITVSFLPIFTLGAQEGRLFRPLAFTKTYAVAMASLVAVTLIPVLMFWLVRGRIRSEKANPISRLLKAVYNPVLDLALRGRWLVLIVAILTHRVDLDSRSSTWVRSSCRRCGRAICSTCRRPFRESPSPRRGSCCSRPIGSSPASRRWSRSSARSGGRRPRPTPRRCR